MLFGFSKVAPLIAPNPLCRSRAPQAGRGSSEHCSNPGARSAKVELRSARLAEERRKPATRARPWGTVYVRLPWHTPFGRPAVVQIRSRRICLFGSFLLGEQETKSPGAIWRASPEGVRRRDAPNNVPRARPQRGKHGAIFNPVWLDPCLCGDGGTVP